MYKQYIIAITFILFFNPCLASQFTFSEGDLVELRYTYQTEETLDFQIRIGNDPPIFQNGQMMIDRLSESQHDRFSVTLSSVRSKVVIIHFHIKNVLTSDAGEYICEVVQNGRAMEGETQTVEVFVKYSPGNTFCEEHQESKNHFEINKIWTVLHCSATLGSQPTFMLCFQNDELTPPLTIPTSNQTHAHQQIWIKKEHPANCCWSTYANPKDMSQCHDYTWNIGMTPKTRVSTEKHFDDDLTKGNRGDYKVESQVPLPIIIKIENEFSFATWFFMMLVTCLSICFATYFLFLYGKRFDHIFQQMKQWSVENITFSSSKDNCNEDKDIGKNDRPVKDGEQTDSPEASPNEETAPLQENISMGENSESRDTSCLIL